MAKRDRSKKFWFIPKRANVHQMLAFLHGMIEKNYDGTTWNPQKQDNLNLELKKLGATKDGEKIAPQGMRTLLASVHYLGFVYLDTTTEPTRIRITEAGYQFYNMHKNDLRVIEKLTKSLTINSSPSVYHQMKKLQITNPIILPHCEDIFVFPFRVVLSMLLKLEYLDKEEIALYVFHTSSMSEIDFRVQEIINFRKLDTLDRENLINQYKKTDVGNITLTQAASSSYFMQFCEGTGVIERNSIYVDNSDKAIDSIKIKSQFRQDVVKVLSQFKGIHPYDFKDNLLLWIDYIGSMGKLYPPVDFKLKNSSLREVYIEVFQHKDIIYTNVLAFLGEDCFPVFIDEEYEVKIYLFDKAQHVGKFKFKGNENCVLDVGDFIKLDCTANAENSLLELEDEIRLHSKATTFTSTMLPKLRLLNKKLGIDKINDKSLRGAYYEYLFYRLLSILKSKNMIDDVFWNGKIGKYNLPIQAPGGKQGTPDIIFIKDGIHYILELTTIKSKSGQHSAELSSVPDHIRLYSKQFRNIKIRGIFCAPEIHERNHNVMKAILLGESIEFISIKDSEFLDILCVENSMLLGQKLESLFV
ncbi:MAG: AlwI family type II restriction endonuclease [Lactobacillus johnsonii]|nr:AlwI family type II restriction endonuclease [[Pasteurella] aerogenes]MDY4501907.1 AlwI family type II restriction endonuclease [Lactobacillus johnsonii]